MQLKNTLQKFEEAQQNIRMCPEKVNILQLELQSLSALPFYPMLL